MALTLTSSRTDVAGTADPHRVAVLLYPGMSTFETGIVSDVFGLWREGGQRPYELVLCQPDHVVRTRPRPDPGYGRGTASTRT